MNLSGTISGQSVEFIVDVVVFRKGDTVAMVMSANLGSADSQALQRLVQAAAAKMS